MTVALECHRPGQSEADPSVFAESAFSGVWEGYLTPDCSVDAATFSVLGRGSAQGYTLSLDGKQVLQVRDGVRKVRCSPEVKEIFQKQNSVGVITLAVVNCFCGECTLNGRIQ